MTLQCYIRDVALAQKRHTHSLYFRLAVLLGIFISPPLTQRLLNTYRYDVDKQVKKGTYYDSY